LRLKPPTASTSGARKYVQVAYSPNSTRCTAIDAARPAIGIDHERRVEILRWRAALDLIAPIRISV
jgi:hypothetical protein